MHTCSKCGRSVDPLRLGRTPFEADSEMLRRDLDRSRHGYFGPQGGERGIEHRQAAHMASCPHCGASLDWRTVENAKQNLGWDREYQEMLHAKKVREEEDRWRGRQFMRELARKPHKKEVPDSSPRRVYLIMVLVAAVFVVAAVLLTKGS